MRSSPSWMRCAPRPSMRSRRPAGRSRRSSATTSMAISARRPGSPFNDDLTAERDAAVAQLERLDAQRERIAAHTTVGDAEDAVMRELTLLRAAVVGEAQDGERAGIDTFRAALVRLFDRFEVVRFPGLGWEPPVEGTVVHQGATPTVERDGQTLSLVPYVRPEAVDWRSPEAEFFPALQRVALDLSRKGAEG